MNSLGHMPGKKTDMHDMTEALQVLACRASVRYPEDHSRGVGGKWRSPGKRHSLRYSWRKRFRYWAGVQPVTLRKHWMK